MIEWENMQELIGQSIWLKENEPLQSSFIAYAVAKSGDTHYPYKQSMSQRHFLAFAGW